VLEASVVETGPVVRTTTFPVVNDPLDPVCVVPVVPVV